MGSLSEEVRTEVLCGRICELESENAKLREERDHWHVEQVHAYGNWKDAHKRVIELEAENAKLLELVSGAYKDMDAWQLVIASSDQWGYGKGCLERLWRLRDAMRELGIEVKLDEHE